jgi:hypothetical protein
LARRYADQVTFVGVPGRDTIPAMQDFVDEHGLQDVTQAADLDGVVWSALGIPGQPAWAFVDGQTGVTTVEFGELGAERLEAAVRALAAG